MTKKEQIIELLEKYGNETEMFGSFIVKDEFSDLADDLVKLFATPDVRLSLPIILQLFKNAKSMPYKEYSKWVKSKMGYEA